ncbi:hypothetical protein LGM43_09415 [Burkholderia seminalis]|uniref:hypothetical protein n=1 Tax=Burkholderia seminalis TaxID=488731 RepID=UPI001CF2DA00|nr:hypothetical protein [Burkholderia seminalis]MCA7950491.1 hypothetical protein [Burkholderia seminalis]
MVPERDTVAARERNAGSHGGKRGAFFTIGGFARGCEKIGGHIGRAWASRNGAALACAPVFRIRPRTHGARRRVSVSRVSKRPNGKPAAACMERHMSSMTIEDSMPS